MVNPNEPWDPWHLRPGLVLDSAAKAMFSSRCPWVLERDPRSPFMNSVGGETAELFSAREPTEGSREYLDFVLAFDWQTTVAEFIELLSRIESLGREAHLDSEEHLLAFGVSEAVVAYAVAEILVTGSGTDEIIDLAQKSLSWWARDEDLERDVDSSRALAELLGAWTSGGAAE